MSTSSVELTISSVELTIKMVQIHTYFFYYIFKTVFNVIFPLSKLGNIISNHFYFPYNKRKLSCHDFGGHSLSTSTVHFELLATIKLERGYRKIFPNKKPLR
jgi:hypothetical protein